jgi:deoxycytidylate deaminase
MYHEWKTCYFSLKNDLAKTELEKENRHIKNLLAEKNSVKNLKITKQRSSGPNIYDTEKIVVTEKPDGTIRKTVVKETIATVTRRKRKISGDDENELSAEAQRKRTKTVDNILNHNNENSKTNKAKMISKIIDDEGGDFGKKVELSSKVLQENESLSVAETNSLQVGTRSSGFLLRQTRTALKKTLGFSPLASAKKVDEYRVETMTVKKEDWKVDKKNLYKYKQGKNKAKPQETTVLMVKDLHNYIAKIALSESNDLDLSMKQLPVCYDADAGGGRFVASFAFLNRKDCSVVLHPFLIYEGSDCRANLEMTLGEFTKLLLN